jgi:hypothetical protein
MTAPGAPAAGRTSAAEPAVRRRQPPRDVVRRYPCPRCGAEFLEPCRGRRGPRVSHHLARVELAVELRYGQRLQLPRTSRQTAADPSAVNRAVLVDSDGADATLAAAPGSAPR